MQHHNGNDVILRRAEAFQKRRLIDRGEARAVNTAAELGDLLLRDRVRSKNMYILRPLRREIGASAPQAVVIAGGDEHAPTEGRQRRPKCLKGFGIDRRAVEQIAREKHQIALLGIGKLRDLRELPALLLPPRTRLGRGQVAERRIQMQIRRVQKFNHIHPPFPPCGSGLLFRPS